MVIFQHLQRLYDHAVYYFLRLRAECIKDSMGEDGINREAAVAEMSAECIDACGLHFEIGDALRTMPEAVNQLYQVSGLVSCAQVPALWCIEARCRDRDTPRPE